MEIPPFPAMLQRLAEIDFWGDDIDLYVRDEWLDADETTSWLRAWTGNPDVDGSRLLVFAQDGSGGYVALYDEAGTTPVEDRPVVVMGSEGERGVAAARLDDFLALLAQGVGPFDAVLYPGEAADPIDEVQAVQKEFGAGEPEPIATLSERAAQAAPGFAPWVESLIR